MNADELIAVFEADIQRMTQQATQLDAQSEQAAIQAQQLRGAAEYARSALQLIQQRQQEVSNESSK